MGIKHQVTSRKDEREAKTMPTHQTGTREQWLKARLELLKAEKELTHRSDELARQRQVEGIPHASDAQLHAERTTIEEV
jgi:hypothetical protein